ncbi:hypothetical protein B0H14DRAFT_2557351 [Mycena olivaceomarginata]|nr:hypothetical protein B0H14DRAFT_2566275 [Mycena olivaceomarginata]KAJ7898319.1 hypothetical protein B0H14DRAFT_2557351 [Mycena olivaceomarginata]
MEELAYIAADDPYALAKKGQVPKTSYRMQNIPPKWRKIKTLVRKAAAAHIPPRFSLPTAYDLHGEDPLSDPPSLLMEVEPAEESNVETQPTKKRGIKQPREDGPDDEIGLRAPSRADSAHTRRSTRTRAQR